MVTIETRIITALNGRSSAPYHELMEQVFPVDEFPRAFERSAHGGPPGCAMAFNAALRRMGGRWDGMGQSRIVSVTNTKAAQAMARSVSDA